MSFKISTMRLTSLLFTIILSPNIANAFFSPRTMVISPLPSRITTIQTSHPPSHILLRMSSSPNNKGNPREYSREIRLREEAESPFRKVRFFFYIATISGALTSLAVSTARIAAGLSGINRDLLEQSVTNAGIDLVGIVLAVYFFRRDVTAQDSRLKRAQKGADLAKLTVRGSEWGVKSLSDLRRGRGIEKRVAIVAGGKTKIREILEEAQTLEEALVTNDIIVVPVVMPRCTAPLGLNNELIELKCVSLPAGGNWKGVMDDEMITAEEQGVDVENEGFCIILKKNGRVGQRTRGVFLGRMVGEVVERQEAGMDVKNI